MNRIAHYFLLDDQAQADDLDEAFAFDGSLHDLDPASLHNHQIRHYDPTPGRWLDESPLGYNGDGENLHPYVGRVAVGRDSEHGEQRGEVDSAESPPGMLASRGWLRHVRGGYSSIVRAEAAGWHC